MYRLHYTTESCNTGNVYSINDLTKRTVRFGGDFSTVDYMFLEYRERKKREGILDIQGILCTD